MQLVVTHFQRRSPELDRWVRLVFLTREANSHSTTHHVGFEEGRRIDMIDREVFVPIEFPYTIRKDQRLWLSPPGDVWLADAEDPVGDQKKVLLDTHAHRPFRSRSAQPDWAKTVRELLANRKELIYVRCNYTHPKNAYGSLIAKVTNRLSDAFGRLAVSVRSMSIKWDSLAFEMRTGRICFCEDPYFLYGPRSLLVDIVPYGSVRAYECVVKKRKVPGLVRQVLNRQEDGLRERIEQLLKHHRGSIEIGLYPETAATHEVELLLNDQTKLMANLVKADSSVELANWLKGGDDNVVRLVFCDQGISHGISAALKGQTNIYSVPYTQPIPVGLLYPKHDLDWRDEIVKAFRDVLRNAIQSLPDESIWEAISDDLQTVGIEPYPFDRISREIGLEGQLMTPGLAKTGVTSSDSGAH